MRKCLDKRLFGETRLRNLSKFFGNDLCDDGQIIRVAGDFMIPMPNSTSYYEWYTKNVALYPLYMCPINFPSQSPFVKTDPISMDFGVGYGVTPPNVDRVAFIRNCMLRAYEHGGDTLKYNSVYESPTEFWSFYKPELKEKYYAAKNKYDTNSRFYDISEKLSLNK